MNCPYCNSQVPDDASKCPICQMQMHPQPTGRPRQSAQWQRCACPPPASVGQYMFCPHCRSQVPFGVSVCPICNARLNTTEVFNDSNGTAVAAFVMALGSIFFPILTIPAIICGHIGLANSRKTLGKTGQGMATAALAIGYITVAVWLLTLLCFVGGCAVLMSLTE